MGLQTYLLAYFQRMASDSLKSSFLFVQAQILLFYHTNAVMIGKLYIYLGLINTISSFVLAFLFAYRAAYPYEKPVHTNFVNYLTISLIMFGLPLSMILGIDSFMLYMAIQLLYAILLGALPSVLVALLTREYTTTENGFLFGFWAATSNLGSIFMSLLFTVMIYYMKLDWKWCLMVPPIMISISAGLLKIFTE